MTSLRQGRAGDADPLSALILSSAPRLLPYLFGTQQSAKDFISQAAKQADGQYSAKRHQVAVSDSNRKLVACITLWDKQLPDEFYSQTVRSLSVFLNPSQIKHLLRANELISQVFLPPTEHQLCIGHLAVEHDHQCMGIGQQLLSFACRQAAQLNKTQIVLDVDALNENAVNFYLKAGFVVSSTTSFAPTDQTFIRMHLAV